MTTPTRQARRRERPPARQALRFTNLYLENWRNFTQVSVDLQGRVFLLGPNASGKSNLLDVFRFLYDIVSVGGGFQAAVNKRGGVSRLRCLAARRYPDVAIRVQMGNDEHSAVWEYELRFVQDNRQRPIIKRERVARGGMTILDRPRPEDEQDAERLTQTYLEQVNVNQEFRDVADFFASVRYLHIVPQLVREPDRSVGKQNDPYGGDFLEQIARTTEKTREARLRRIRDALRVAVPQLLELELWRDARGTPHLRGRYEHWRAQGAWQAEDQFSDGTLRLMGLLWAMQDGDGPLLLEEPELSLHPEVVRFVPQMLARVQRRSGRQVLVSTHSADLLRDEGIGLDEVLLLVPGTEGTSVRPAAGDPQIRILLDGGSSLADIVVPATRPIEVQQLALFGK
jgi:predicted ATPase